MNDTIAAIATPLMPSAIGILRLSGPDCAAIVDRVFTPAAGAPMSRRPSRTLVYGALHDGAGRVIDHCLATLSRGPASYTGEDTAELQCHGSPVALTMGLEALFAAGARQAGPGEFTRRAFVNGRLDLTRVESVADLIHAQSEEAVLQAAGQLGGALAERIDGVYSALTDLMAHFHAVLDYPDEDIDPLEAEDMARRLDGAAGELDALTASYRRGRALTEGIPCAILGRPNAGKSTLFNALVGYERAIVTPIPGTTRDTVEETVRLGGCLLRLIDTAGLRESADPVERLGVERSRAALERAELLLVVVDQSHPVGEEELALIRQAMAAAPTLLLANKCDLPAATALSHIPELPPAIPVCAKTGEGLDALEEAVAALFPADPGLRPGQLLTNARQAEGARRAGEAVRRGAEALRSGLSPDAALTDVEEAMEALGQLTGRSLREDITGRIFARFCVGK